MIRFTRQLLFFVVAGILVADLVLNYFGAMRSPLSSAFDHDFILLALAVLTIGAHD